MLHLCLNGAKIYLPSEAIAVVSEIDDSDSQLCQLGFLLRLMRVAFLGAESIRVPLLSRHLGITVQPRRTLFLQRSYQDLPIS